MKGTTSLVSPITREGENGESSIVDRAFDAAGPEVACRRVVGQQELCAAGGVRESAGAAGEGEGEVRVGVVVVVGDQGTGEGRVQLVAIGCGKDDPPNHEEGVWSDELDPTSSPVHGGLAQVRELCP